MSFHSWLLNLRSVLAPSWTRHNHRRRASLRARTHRLNLEPLEGRCVPALYTVTELGTLGGYSTYASDLNQAGQVVGFSDTSDGFNHAFVWDNGTLIDLGTLGGNCSWAEGINDLGQVVGAAYLPGDAASHAFLVDPQGGVWFQDSDLDGRNDFMTDLGSLNGSDSSQASDLNNAGQVVGSFYTTDGFNHAFLWDAANGMVDLGTPSGLAYSGANAINASGQVTGSAGYYDETAWHSSAFLWDAANGMTALGAGPADTDSEAAALNDAGQVVGYQWNAAVGYYAAFLWMPDSPNGHTGSFNDLGVLPGGIDSLAAGINNIGQVVGWSSVDNGWDYYPRAFLWDEVGGMVDLNNQLLPGSNTILESALAVNDDSVIAAGGYNGAGEYRAYLLTPLPADTPLISVSDAPVVREGNAGTVTASFTVTLSVASTQTVTVAYATSNGTTTAGDYTSKSGTVTFGPNETSKTITVQVIGDRLPEANETFVVNLSSPTNAVIEDSQGVGTISDDEPRISITNVSKLEGNGGKTLFVFEVTLTVPGSSLGYDQAVSMSFATANGAARKGEDYIAKTGTLTFAPGETTKTITIEAKGDSKKEANETFYLDLFGNSSNSLFTKNRGIGTILNDD